MASSLFQWHGYYRITSDRHGPSSDLQADHYNETEDAPFPIFFNSISNSTENWQIFYQEPIYLIRNYNYGVKYQLGITEESQVQPALLPISGNLTQQWNITRWGDGGETYRLTNMWLGSEQMLSVVDGHDGTPIPVMTTAQSGSHWTFVPNRSNATSSFSEDLLQSVALQAAPSSTPTPTSISTTTVAATTSTATSLSSSISKSPTPRSITGGAIAGIVVAIVVATLLIVGFQLFVWRRHRRQQQRHGLVVNHATLAQKQVGESITAMHEADARYLPSEIGFSKEKERIRIPAEMPE